MQLLVPPMSRQQLRALVETQSRVPLGMWPTPLEPFPRFSRHLGGPRVYIKREDLTGLGLGGNKTRVLEFRLADALHQGCDCIVASLHVQSNSARQLTAAANRLDLETHLVLHGPGPEAPNGNLLLNLLLGANICFSPHMPGSSLDNGLMQVADDLRAKGRRPYVMNIVPGFEVASALAAALCALECRDQMESLGEKITYIYISSRGKGQAGLVLTSLLLQDAVNVVGIAAGRGEAVPARTARIVNQTAEKLGVRLQCDESDVRNDEDFAGAGYGIPSPAALDAILLVARLEGVLLDPVYTGKAMAGLIEHVRTGTVPKEAAVVFVHTGGTPALFHHADFMAQATGGLSHACHTNA